MSASGSPAVRVQKSPIRRKEHPGGIHEGGGGRCWLCMPPHSTLVPTPPTSPGPHKPIHPPTPKPGLARSPRELLRTQLTHAQVTA
eukprot:59568-Chlamydomonas_euryale.AAC.3